LKDVCEVLRQEDLNFRRMQKEVETLQRFLSQKELELQRLQQEIAALQTAIPLLAEDRDRLESKSASPPSFAQFRGSGRKEQEADENAP
jgi:predicted  nucleic acid-binding Zn-ribbon protein